MKTLSIVMVVVFVILAIGGVVMGHDKISIILNLVGSGIWVWVYSLVKRGKI